MTNWQPVEANQYIFNDPCVLVDLASTSIICLARFILNLHKYLDIMNSVSVSAVIVKRKIYVLVDRFIRIHNADTFCRV